MRFDLNRKAPGTRHSRSLTRKINRSQKSLLSGTEAIIRIGVLSFGHFDLNLAIRKLIGEGLTPLNSTLSGDQLALFVPHEDKPSFQNPAGTGIE